MHHVERHPPDAAAEGEAKEAFHEHGAATIFRFMCTKIIARIVLAHAILAGRDTHRPLVRVRNSCSHLFFSDGKR